MNDIMFAGLIVGGSVALIWGASALKAITVGRGKKNNDDDDDE